jgi:hypothetical protein
VNHLLFDSSRLAPRVACLLVALVGCTADGGEGPGGSMTSFSVQGTWAGTATDDDTALDLVLELDNDGGNGIELAGTLDVEGVGPLAFSGAYVDTGAGASRPSTIDAEDGDGYLYTLRGIFSSKRMDMGQLASTNPALDVDILFLDVTLERAL